MGHRLLDCASREALEWDKRVCGLRWSREKKSSGQGGDWAHEGLQPGGSAQSQSEIRSGGGQVAEWEGRERLSPGTAAVISESHSGLGALWGPAEEAQGRPRGGGAGLHAPAGPLFLSPVPLLLGLSPSLPRCPKYVLERN